MDITIVSKRRIYKSQSQTKHPKQHQLIFYSYLYINKKFDV